jgi:formylglycine-generating enzyme required for sulfatase activity
VTPGERIGRYEIVREIGRGGQATVYEALDVELGRRVGLKILDRSTRSGEAAERLAREARAVARLDHPNIVKIHDVAEEKGRIHLAMELVEGGTLEEVLARRVVSVREAVSITERIARAAHHAHERGIVHRDIKPGNILVAADGTPKLTDFGFALDAGEEAKLTRSGTTMGTPAYMSPEQIAGRTREFGPSTDVYAMGAALFVMLAGRPPFAAETTLALFKKIVNDAPPRPSQFRHAMPPEADAICLKCLAKAPADRYHSAGELANDCARLLSMRSVSARRSAVAGRALPFLRSHRVPAAVVIICAVVSALLEVGTRAAVRYEGAETRRIVAGMPDSGALHVRRRKLDLEMDVVRQESRDLITEVERLRSEVSRARELRQWMIRTEAARRARLARETAERERKAAEEARRSAARQSSRPAPATPRKAAPRPPQIPVTIASGKSATVELPGGIDLEMVYVPPGTFTMGEKEYYGLGPPKMEPRVYRVEITRGFFIGKFEMTREQFRAVVPARLPERDLILTRSLPMTRVKWDEAMDFCRRLSQAAQKHFRLPTEAEWEYACRAGTSSRFSCGGHWKVLTEYAWYSVGAGRTLHPVGGKLPNSWGIHDMHGNAAEWCLDWHGGLRHLPEPRIDPVGLPGGIERVVRGGSSWNNVGNVSSAVRGFEEPSVSSQRIGFRIVMDEGPREPLPPESPEPWEWTKASGIFVEAEAAMNANDLGGPVLLDGASGVQVLPALGPNGERAVHALTVETDLPRASIVFRLAVSHADAMSQGMRLEARVSRRHEGGTRSWSIPLTSFVGGRRGKNGLRWLYSKENHHLPRGEYELEFVCKGSAPSCRLDVVGIVPDRKWGQFLPNSVADGVLKEGGSYIDTTPREEPEPAGM